MTESDESADYLATIALTLRRLRLLLRRIHDEELDGREVANDPSIIAAARIVEDLDLAGFEIRRKPGDG